MTAPTRSITLAVHPDRRGFGWVAFTGPFAVYDWGRSSAKRDKNAECLAKIEALIERLSPETLVLEAFDRRYSVRRDRVARLSRAIIALATSRGVEVAIYTRADVTASFADAGARTRYEIAQTVARHVPAFDQKLPKRRKAWHAEDPRMAAFSAGALVLTHYRLGASSLLDQLIAECAEGSGEQKNNEAT
ncbi:hypothetical protein [Brevundimonas sp.]|jgi:hypothetical protein|uniref:hypothetical protein n=1 Tax=Brevundimonas sp. TaxID=1871086 RepID=UPI002E157144|nr:hypothetical protein [Brevundimonas sp.]